MPDLSRSQFCAVASLSSDALSSLARRNQLPFAVDQKASGRGYTFFEAFLTIISQDFVEGHGVNVTRAAEIAGSLPETLQAEWPRVVETAFQLCSGTDDQIEEIMCGWSQMAGVQHPKPVCGTNRDIAKACHEIAGATIRLSLSSASRGLAVLINRANRLEIEIPAEFWTGSFAYRERITTSGVSKAVMQQIISDSFDPSTAEK